MQTQCPPVIHAPQLSLRRGVSVCLSTLSKHRTRHPLLFKRPATVLRPSPTLPPTRRPLKKQPTPPTPPQSNTVTFGVAAQERSTTNPTPFSRNRRSPLTPKPRPHIHDNYTVIMGLLSRKKDGDDDGNRKALFGSRKSEKAAPAQSNPCMSSLPGRRCKDMANQQQMPPPQARTPMHSRHHSTRAPTTGTARTRHQQ